MKWFPYKSETIVLPFSVSELKSKLEKVVKPLDALNKNAMDEQSFEFNGVISDQGFRISKIIKHPENYLPLIVGKFDPTSTGCLVFIKYQLFFSTLFFIIFWSIVTLLMGIFFIVFYQKYLYAAVAIGVGISNYFIAIANFKKQVNKSKNLLMRVLD